VDTAVNDPMDVDQPATTAAPQPILQPVTVPYPFAQGSDAGNAVSPNRIAEKSILDEDVPYVEDMEEAINPTRMQTMFPRHPGRSASKWRPRTALDGRPIDD
jgi:hypothetical protein